MRPASLSSHRIGQAQRTHLANRRATTALMVNHQSWASIKHPFFSACAGQARPYLSNLTLRGQPPPSTEPRRVNNNTAPYYFKKWTTIDNAKEWGANLTLFFCCSKLYCPCRQKCRHIVIDQKTWLWLIVFNEAYDGKPHFGLSCDQVC